MQKKETPQNEVAKEIISEEDINELMYNVVKQIEIETERTNQKIILETNDISVESAIEYFKTDFDIYCLGMPNETVESLA